MTERRPARAEREITRLRAHLAEVEEALSAIRTGNVDAIAVEGPLGRRIFTLEGADQPYRLLAEQMSEGTASMSADTTILFCNQRLAQMVGRKRHTLIGSTALSLVPDADRESFQALLAPKRRAHRRSELRFRRSDGAVIPVLVSISILPPKNGYRFCLVATDLSEIKASELERDRINSRLRTTSATMNAIVEQSTDLIVVCNAQGRMDYVSSACNSLLGRASDDLVGKSVAMIVAPEAAGELLHLVSQPQSDSHPRLTLRCPRWDGSLLWLETSRTTVSADSQDGARAVLTFHDITEHLEHQQQIQTALHEKEVLLREIYHRVKNNLQVIQSLLKMQARVLSDEKTQQALREMAQRVSAMALVHERLYQMHDLTGLSLPNYLLDLFNGALASQSLDSNQIRLTLDAEEIPLALEQAVPFGLMMNELICNSLKHGFRDGRQGNIDISIRRSGAGTHFAIKDDGVGLPPDFNAGGSSSMGLNVAKSLAQRLGGQLVFSSENGCCVQADLTRL
jgi:PAS domain S-box-containing protein